MLTLVYLHVTEISENRGSQVQERFSQYALERYRISQSSSASTTPNNNKLLLKPSACRPTPFSHCHGLRARRFRRSASDHRGACRASTISVYQLSSAKPLE
jgi:hypothetical protein